MVQIFMMPRGWMLTTLMLPVFLFSATSRSKFSLIRWNIFTSTTWVAITFYTDIHGRQRMNPKDFEWNFSITIGWIAMKFCTAIKVPLRMNCNTFRDPLNFPSSPIIKSKFESGLWLNICKANVIPISLSCVYTRLHIWKVLKALYLIVLCCVVVLLQVGCGWPVPGAFPRRGRMWGSLLWSQSEAASPAACWHVASSALCRLEGSQPGSPAPVRQHQETGHHP